MTVGGFLAKLILRVSPPRISSSSPWTIVTTCWPGFRASETSSPSARSLIWEINCRTAGTATSASSSARRISRAVASISASVSLPLPRRFLKVEDRRSVKVLNTCDYPCCRLSSNRRARALNNGTWRLTLSIHSARYTVAAILLSCSKGRSAGNQCIYESLCFEWSKIIGTFTQSNKLNWNPQLTLDGYHDAALGRPVHLCEDDPGHVYSFGKDFGLGQTVLSGGGINDE